MRKFEIKALGLEEIKFEDTREIEGGGWKDAVIPGGALVAAWEWVNKHWDALVEGFKRGSEEGAELYM